MPFFKNAAFGSTHNALQSLQIHSITSRTENHFCTEHSLDQKVFIDRYVSFKVAI